MSEQCLFCRIAKREVDAGVVFEDDSVVAFRDINPQAPVHVLIIPKQHVATVNDLREEHAELLSHLFLTAAKLARDHDVADEGYRLVVNCQEGAGQSVFHLHMHLLGGRPFKWPPG
jgi:histidine triad (HIT) family protein